MMKNGEKASFFIRQLLRGLLWFALLLAIFYILKDSIDIDYIQWLAPVYENPGRVYLIYALSEFFFGIIPPEIFMMWGLRSGVIGQYALIILFLAVISYMSGVIGFRIGRALRQTAFFLKIKQRFLGKYEAYFKRFGSFLIVVAAVTPLPFSGTSMLIGSIHFPFKTYLILALSRFIRFAAYSIIIWKTYTL